MIRDYSYSEIEYGINEWVVGKNAERDKIILKLKLLKGYSYKRIADYINNDEFPPEYHLEVRQIQRVIRKRCDVIFRHI